MRPRRLAGDDLGPDVEYQPGGFVASMRPRRLAGDDDHRPQQQSTESEPASMRPRRLAGDDAIKAASVLTPTSGFNEAPAFSRG